MMMTIFDGMVAVEAVMMMSTRRSTLAVEVPTWLDVHSHPAADDSPHFHHLVLESVYAPVWTVMQMEMPVLRQLLRVTVAVVVP